MESLHVETLKLNHMLIDFLSFYLLLQDMWDLKQQRVLCYLELSISR